MRSIRLLQKQVTGWKVVPADEQEFEEAALHACDLVVARDFRIGKVPGARRASGFIREWQQQAPYGQLTDWMFASTRLTGKQPRVANMRWKTTSAQLR